MSLALVALVGCGDSETAGSTTTETSSSEVTTFEIPSGTMEPTIPAGTSVTVDLDNTHPAVGDVIVFHPPLGADLDKGCAVKLPKRSSCPTGNETPDDVQFIKRVVAGPGQSVSIEDGVPQVDGAPTFTEQIQPCSGSRCNLPEEIVVPRNHYFVMGDSPASSKDSRQWGPLPEEWVLGSLVE